MPKTFDDAMKLLLAMRKLRLELRKQQAYLAEMESRAEYQSPRIDGEGGGHGSGKQDGREAKLVLLADLRGLVEEQEQEAEQQENTFREVAMRMSDWTLRELLIMRYLWLYKWQDIADALGYDLRYVYKLHVKALEELQQVLTEAAEA